MKTNLVIATNLVIPSEVEEPAFSLATQLHSLSYFHQKLGSKSAFPSPEPTPHTLVVTP